MSEGRSQQDDPAERPDAAGRSPYSGRILLTNRPDDISAIRDRLLKAIESCAFPDAAGFAIRLAFDEAIANAFKHGHAALPGDEPIVVTIDVDRSAVRITVEDRGPGFDPERVPDPTLDENLARPSGRGIMLMRAYMTDIRFNERGNRVTLVYERPDR
jgi:serine/threonine-protein kinase RsbW